MHRAGPWSSRALIMEPCGVNCFLLHISQPVVDSCQLVVSEEAPKSGLNCPAGPPGITQQKCVTIPKSSVSRIMPVLTPFAQSPLSVLTLLRFWECTLLLIGWLCSAIFLSSNKNSDAQKGKGFFPIVQFVRQFNQMWALVSLQMPVVTLSIESFWCNAPPSSPSPPTPVIYLPLKSAIQRSACSDEEWQMW